MSAKNVIIASKIGEIPLQSEKLPKERNANTTTQIEDKNQTTKDTNIIMAIPTISTFGGPKSSSVAREISERVLSLFDIVTKQN